MRLRELSPIIEPVLVATTQHPVMMVPTGDWRLSFFCPTCGKPFSCSIFVGDSVRERTADVVRRWKVDPMPELVEDTFNKFSVPNTDDWFDRVTIMPSINYTCGHGPKKPTCQFHGNITSGYIVAGNL